MKIIHKKYLIAILLSIDVISIFFHFYMGKTNSWIFWATSIIGTVAIICSAFSTIDLILDRMYRYKQPYDH
jgi:membrane protein YdbS with pleckstrin-like domain